MFDDDIFVGWGVATMASSDTGFAMIHYSLSVLGRAMILYDLYLQNILQNIRT